MALNRTPPLEERVQNIQADLNAWLDARAAEVKATCPGVPVEVIRMTIIGHNAGCPCNAFKAIKAADDAEAQRTAAA